MKRDNNVLQAVSSRPENGYTRSRTRARTNASTMADVAKLAGVSAQTVSRVLRNPNGSAPHIVESVHKAVKATSYVQNLAASNLASNKSKTVAAVIPLLSSTIFGETMQGLSNILLPAGYQIIIGHTDYQQDREEALVRSLLGRRPDAFVLVGVKHTKTTRDLLLQADVPIIETWDWTPKPIDQLIGFSNKQAFIDIVAYLKSSGRKQPLFVGSIRDGDDRAESRLRGYAQGMLEHFPDVEPKSLVVDHLPYTVNSGRELLALALTAHPECDVLMFSSDLLASGALLACQSRGISVPKDLAITGFGDYEIARELRPALTTVSVPSTQMGEEAAFVILDRLGEPNSATITHKRPKKFELKYQLIVRDSA
jgi:LacI family gluconate utilization system Gnt-I transcriptional repressor